MKDSQIAIIIYSCEKNNSMWDIVKYFFDKYWAECPYNIVLLTDYDRNRKGKELGFDYVVECDADWSTMMKTALNQLRVSYFITWMDDFLLCDYVDTAEVEKLFSCMKNRHALNIRLVETSYCKIRRIEKDVREIEPGTAYSFSTHAGIWETKGFINQVKKKQSAWDFERKGSIGNKNIKQPILASNDYFLPYIECVRKGKWFPEGVALLKRNNLDYKKTNKPLMSNWDLTKVYLKGAILDLNSDYVLKIQNLRDSIFCRNRKTY